MNNDVNLRDILEISQQTNRSINSLRREFRGEVNRIDDRVQIIESKTDNLLGKIGIGVMVISAIFSSAVAYIFSLFKK